jgi:hypothetical protein
MQHAFFNSTSCAPPPSALEFEKTMADGEGAQEVELKKACCEGIGREWKMENEVWKCVAEDWQ